MGDKVFFKKNIKFYLSNLRIVNETNMKTIYTFRLGLSALILVFKFNLTIAQLPILASTTGYDTVRHRLQSAYFDSLYVFHEGILSRSGTIDQNTKAFYNLQYIAAKDNRTDTLNLTVHVTDSPGCYIANMGNYRLYIDKFSNFSGTGFITRCADNAVLTQNRNVNTNILGLYYSINCITDSTGVTNCARREVEVVCRTSPSISVAATKGIRFPLGTYVSEMGFEVTVTNSCTPNSNTIVIDSGAFQPNIEGNYYVQFSAIDSLGNRSLKTVRVVQIRTPTMLNELHSTAISVYPNPSQGAFYLESEWPIQNVQVLGIDGRKVQADYNVATQQLNLTNKGIYLLEAATEKGIVRKRLVVY